MKKILFFANTLYQVLVSIHIAEIFCKEDENSLIVCSETKSLNELIKSEKFNDVFSKVYFTEFSNLEKFEKSAKFIRHFEHLMRELNPGWFLRKLGISLESYFDEIFFYAPNRLFKDVYKWNYKSNPRMQLHYYQHGVLSYLGSGAINGFDVDRIFSIINRLFFGIDFKRLNFDWYCYNKDLMICQENRLIVQIPSDNWDKKTIDKLNKVFDYRPSALPIKERFIFFEQAGEYIYNLEAYEECIKRIADVVGRDNFIIKKHPRIQTALEADFKIYSGEEAWELYLLNNDCSDKIFITGSSSACATAQYMFGKSCKIIYLYKLLKNVFDPEVLEFTSFFEKSSLIFGNVYIVETEKELEEILNSLIHGEEV